MWWLSAELEYLAALVFGLPLWIYTPVVFVLAYLIVVAPFSGDYRRFRQALFSTRSGQKAHQAHCPFIARGPAFSARRLEWGESRPPCKLCHPERKESPHANQTP